MLHADTELFSETLIDYLGNRGWSRTESGPDIAVLRKVFVDQEEEIVLPIDRSYADYRQRVLEAIQFLAKHEHCSEEDILEELLPHSKDLVTTETRKAKRFVYEGLGFPVVLRNVSLVKKRGVWTPAIDYNKLQKAVLLALTHKPVVLTGYEVHFIRTYFEMTLENFGKRFGVTHAVVLTWEKAGDKLVKINSTAELCIRLFILEKLNMSAEQILDEEFDELLKEFLIEKAPMLKRLSKK